MTRRIRTALAAAFIGGAAGVTLVGCSNGPESPKTPPTTSQSPAAAPPAADGEHGHKPSAHGGIVVPIGSDSYHAEAVFEKGGVVRLYTLGKDEAKVLEVPAQSLTGFVKLEGGTEAESIVFAPKPQPGDSAEMTSLFTTHLPKEFAGKRVEITIPSIRIGGERFRLAFKSAPEADAGHDMPAKLATEEERKVFLTPGGKYTEADIKANGSTTASVKFKGIKPVHDTKPKPGDMLCPISMTKASPNFQWTIGGKLYQFCCLPCVEEFVTIAKETPADVKEPEEYRKK
jgi:hypothetical protein